MKSILVLISIIISSVFYAQNSLDTTPTYQIQIESLSSILIPKLNENQLLKEDNKETLKDKHIAPRFAIFHPINLTSNNFGEWLYNQHNELVWEMKINSSNAQSLSLIFDDFSIGKDASVSILDKNRNVVLGPYFEGNAFNNRLSTPPTKEKSIIIQYKLKKNFNTKGNLSISGISQGYRDIFDNTEAFNKKSFGSSGECNNNVACAESNPWKDQVKSVGLIILDSGTRWCSGCMVGNTKKDSTPYFLTAFHCVDKNDNGIISPDELSDVDTWTFHFNYESSDCTPSVDGDLTQSISGSKLIASYYDSDMALLELSSTPPEDYEVYYAGWNRENIAALNGIGIHHPAGDVKKISFEEDNIIDSPLDSDNRWRVPNWNDGVTEGGSSGSPFFNESGLVVGQLYGGNATCNNLSDAIETNDLDEYGKFSTSWNSGEVDSNKLAPWLDSDDLKLFEIEGYYHSSVGIPIINSNDNTFDIYPNPTTPGRIRLNIQINSPENTGTLSIYNLFGQLVYSKEIPNNINRYIIHPSDLGYGSYVMEAKFGEERVVKHLLVIAEPLNTK